MTQDEQPDIVSFPGKEFAASESIALDEALKVAAEGIAQSLRDDELKLQAVKKRQQRWLTAFYIGLLSMVCVLIFSVLLNPQWFQAKERGKSTVSNTTTKSTLKRNENSSQLPNPLPSDFKLATGNFTMRLPGGEEWVVRIIALEDNRFRLISYRNLNSLGFYELRGNRFVMVQPDDPRLTEFQWLVTSNDSLEMIAQPTRGKTGGNYLGTLLSRESDLGYALPAKENVEAPVLNPRSTTPLLGDPQLRPGNYTMSMPFGFQWQIRLQAIGGQQYRITSRRNLNIKGLYELVDKRLVMREPDDQRLTEFQWYLTDNDFLELVEEPHARKTGASYLGTALTRNLESE